MCAEIDGTEIIILYKYEGTLLMCNFGERVSSTHQGCECHVNFEL